MTLTTAPGYVRLRTRVTKILAEGKERAQQAVEAERIRTYWELGGELVAYLDAHGADYGSQAIKKLAPDVGLSASLLYDVAGFRRQNRKFPARGKLTWTHYRRVQTVPDLAARDYYLTQASDHGWTVRELERRIRSGAFEHRPNDAAPDRKNGQPPTQLRAQRGDLYHYRVALKQDRSVLDLGFRTYHPLSDRNQQRFEIGDLIRSVPDARSTDGYRLEPTTSNRHIYTFRARVDSVIDGDTVWATIDLGFDTLVDQKLRLRGIDTPELGTVAGQRARDFLVEALHSVDEFIVTTSKLDLYDRWLADLFILPGESNYQTAARKGRYLNCEMIVNGLARLWTKS